MYLFVAISMTFIVIFYRPTSAFPQELAVILVVVGAGLISLVGYWMITTPEPGVQAVSGLAVRSVVRWTMVGGVAISVMNLMAMAVDPIFSIDVSLIVGFLMYVSCISLCIYARRLALRVPDYRLAKHTRVVMWGIATAPVVIFIFGVLAVAIYMLQLVGVIWIYIMIAAPVLGVVLAYGTFGIWSLVLLFWYRRVALSAAVAAEEIGANGN